MKKKKVYCKDCKWLEKTWIWHDCLCLNECWEDDYYEPHVWKLTKPEERNKNNDCKGFVKK